MTYDELKQAQAAGAHIYGIGDDGRLHRIENPGWSCPPDRYLALLPFDSDLVRDAARYQYLAKHARQSTAYDVFGKGGHWSIGVFSADNYLTFGQAIDAAIHAQAGGSES